MSEPVPATVPSSGEPRLRAPPSVRLVTVTTGEHAGKRALFAGSQLLAADDLPPALLAQFGAKSADLLAQPGIVGIKESILDLGEVKKHITLCKGTNKVFFGSTALYLTQFM